MSESLDNIGERLERDSTAPIGKQSALPPVHLWNPAYSGELELTVSGQGEWIYQGNAIGRQSLVRLFASILKREGDEYFLVTPVEKWKINVELAPLFIIKMRIEGSGKQQNVYFFSATDDEFLLCKDHPIRLVNDDKTNSEVPVVQVRSGLEGVLARPVYYRLAEYLADEAGKLGIYSGGEFFALDT